MGRLAIIAREINTATLALDIQSNRPDNEGANALHLFALASSILARVIRSKWRKQLTGRDWPAANIPAPLPSHSRARAPWLTVFGGPLGRHDWARKHAPPIGCGVGFSTSGGRWNNGEQRAAFQQIKHQMIIGFVWFVRLPLLAFARSRRAT